MATLEQTAIFLLMLDFDRDAIVEALKQEHPYETEDDMNAAVDAAELHRTQFQKDIGAAMDREAIEEEHRG